MMGHAPGFPVLDSDGRVRIVLDPSLSAEEVARATECALVRGCPP